MHIQPLLFWFRLYHRISVEQLPWTSFLAGATLRGILTSSGKLVPLFVQFVWQYCISREPLAHASLQILFLTKTVGLATPRGSNTDAKLFSTSLFVVPAKSPLKLTARVSSLLFQGSPSNFASMGFTSNCSLAYVCPSSLGTASASSSQHLSAIYAA